FRDAFNTADAGANEHAGIRLLAVARWMPSGIVECLASRTHRKDNKLVDLALLLWLHPMIGIIGGIRTVATRDLAGNFARDVRNIETVDFPGAAFTLEQTRPSRLDAASERRDHS